MAVALTGNSGWGWGGNEAKAGRGRADLISLAWLKVWAAGEQGCPDLQILSRLKRLMFGSR